MKSVHNGCDLRGGEFLLPGVGVANCGRTGWGPLLWRRPGRGVCLLPGRAAWRTEPLPLGICSVFLLEVSLLSTGVPLPFVLLTTLKITAKTRPTSPGTVLCLVHSPPPPAPPPIRSTLHTKPPFNTTCSTWGAHPPAPDCLQCLPVELLLPVLPLRKCPEGIWGCVCVHVFASTAGTHSRSMQLVTSA